MMNRNDMGWMYIDVDLGYPPGWTPGNLTICFSGYHTAGIGEVFSVRAKEFERNDVIFLVYSQGEDATNITDACFSDDAAQTGAPMRCKAPRGARVVPTVGTSVGGRACKNPIR